MKHSVDVHISLLEQCAHVTALLVELRYIRNLLCKRFGNFFRVKIAPQLHPTPFILETKLSVQRYSIEFRIQTAVASDIGIFIATRFIHVHHFRFLVRRFVDCFFWRGIL